MTIEEKLKEFIVDKYGSILAFTTLIGLPNSTMMGMLKRGIHNASISNVITLCNALNISVDALADDKILELEDKKEDSVEILDLYKRMRNEMLNHDVVTLNGQKIDKERLEKIIYSLDVNFEVLTYKVLQKK